MKQEGRSLTARIDLLLPFVSNFSLALLDELANRGGVGVVGVGMVRGLAGIGTPAVRGVLGKLGVLDVVGRPVVPVVRGVLGLLEVVGTLTGPVVRGVLGPGVPDVVLVGPVVRGVLTGVDVPFVFRALDALDILGVLEVVGKPVVPVGLVVLVVPVPRGVLGTGVLGKGLLEPPIPAVASDVLRLVANLFLLFMAVSHSWDLWLTFLPKVGSEGRVPFLDVS